MSTDYNNVNITDDPTEWEQMEGDPEGWIHKYHRNLFSIDGGKTFYDITLPLMPNGEAMVFDSRPMPLERVIAYAIGEASMCWTDIDKAGVFESERGVEITKNLQEWINEHYELKENYVHA